jgi:O-antigen biosynthesis protein
MRHKYVIVTALRNQTSIIERIPPRQHRHDGDNQRMTHSIEDLHVYLRSIKADERTSLSVLASLVHPEAVVLDLGCGSGALGQYLREHRGCSMDGLTLSEAEAEHARPHYRSVEVSD